MIAMNPTVSILIPVYNREKLIGPCIESALKQTVPDFEVIVSDNASSDGTWDICQHYAMQDNRVKVFRNASNIGPVRNWQRCLEEAQGDYGKILFSDDLIDPRFLEKTVHLMQMTRDAAFVFTDVVVGENPWQGQMLYRYWGPAGIGPASCFIRQTLFEGSLPVSPGCGLFRLTDLKKYLKTEIPSPTLRHFSAHGAGPDMLLYLCVAGQYPKVAYLPEPLSFFRIHAESITIGDREQYLGQCYRQARIWFAEQYLNNLELGRYYAYEWRREYKETGVRSRPAEWLRKYTNKRSSLKLSDILWVAYYKTVRKNGPICPDRG